MGMKTKLLLASAILIFLPMLFICLYNYYTIRNILVEREYERLDEDMEKGIRSLEEMTADYETVLDILYVDRSTHLYLCQDYSAQGFEKMFYYLDSYFQNIMLVQNDIQKICIYSTNPTLPQDRWYFFPQDAFPKNMYLKVMQKNGAADFLGVWKEDRARYFMFGCLMNYYSAGNICNIMTIQVKSEAFENLLGEASEESRSLLLDEDGMVLASTDKRFLDHAFFDIAGMASDKLKNQHMELAVGNETWLCTGKSAKNGMMLVKMVRPDSIFANIRKTLNRMLWMLVLVAIFVIAAVCYFAGTFTEKVQMVRYMAKQIGAGRFEYKLPDLGKDEIGEIADIFNQLNEEIQKLIYDNYEKQLKLKDSHLNLMQEQINPHFLYNALSVISSIAMQNRDRRTVESIQNLADFYRISLNKGREILTVQDELDLLKNYMKIQLIRFGDWLDIVYECEEQLLTCHTIKLILQPLVENAIHHGMRENGMLHIIVRIYQKERCLIMEVADDGRGIPEEKLKRLRSEIRDSQEGFGLINVDIRVKLHYGEQYGINIESREGQETKVTVYLPVE